MLLPRRESQAIVLRHVRKLRRWIKGSHSALDLEVADIPGSVLHELCLTDSFGFRCGLRLAFFDDALASPDGQVWWIGSRREDEPLTAQMIETLDQRKTMVEKTAL